MRATAAFALILAGMVTSLEAQPDLVGPYTTEEGFDRPGSDYQSFEQTGDYQGHDLCRDACFSQPRCKAYTYVKPGVAGPKAFCRLKDKVPAPVEDDCCISAVKGGKPKQPAIPALQLQWLGWDADQVGKGPAADKPDGAPDHRFTLQVRLPSMQEVVAIALAAPGDGGVRWSSSGAPAEYLAVELDGQRLNYQGPRGPSLGEHTGKKAFDLYAHDIGQLGAGGTMIAEITLADRRRISHQVELEPPPDRLLGIWQMHCPNNAPHAFEPWTLSGRVQMLLHPDGSLTGFWGAMPLVGKLGEGGAVSGTAARDGERVTWKGELERVRPGRPLRGRGSFEFTETKDACVASGSWGSWP